MTGLSPSDGLSQQGSCCLWHRPSNSPTLTHGELWQFRLFFLSSWIFSSLWFPTHTDSSSPALRDQSQMGDPRSAREQWWRRAELLPCVALLPWTVLTWQCIYLFPSCHEGLPKLGCFLFCQSGFVTCGGKWQWKDQIDLLLPYIIDVEFVYHWPAVGIADLPTEQYSVTGQRSEVTGQSILCLFFKGVQDRLVSSYPR